MDFFQNEQIVEIGQAKTILQLLINFEELVFKKRYNFETAVKQLFSADDNNSIIHKLGKTDLAQIRPLDLAYALNRFRLLKLK
ncbi:MAG: hypothetical protein ACD_79C00767G0001 [uncultured bacterium]|nr:MAG: hypothetical protein ACD_79C00767G0001 [uncultured bacterium]